MTSHAVDAGQHQYDGSREAAPVRFTLNLLNNGRKDQTRPPEAPPGGGAAREAGPPPADPPGSGAARGRGTTQNKRSSSGESQERSMDQREAGRFTEPCPVTYCLYCSIPLR